MKNKILFALPTMIEWYDFALFGFFVPIFSTIYFKNLDNTENILKLFGIFAVGFIARPIGSIIFGHIGDKFDRVKALKYTPVCMGTLTALIGLIPDYKTIGIYSIVFLLSIRILQGIILGGDFSGNILYLCENSNKYKNVLGGIGSLSGSVGITIASFVSSLVYAAKADYLWRIAFIICFPIGIFFTFLRRNMQESKLINKRPKVSNPLQHLIKNDLSFFFYGLGILIAQACSFYFLFFYTPSYINGLGLSFSHASYLINTILLFLHILLIPFFGFVADKFNGKNLLFLSFLIQLILGLLVFSDRIQFTSIAFLMFLSLTTAINAATIPNFISNLLPIETRYTSFSLIYSIGFGIMGGSTPYLASKFSMISKNCPSLILIITGLLSLILISFKIFGMNRHAQNAKGMIL